MKETMQTSTKPHLCLDLFLAGGRLLKAKVTEAKVTKYRVIYPQVL